MVVPGLGLGKEQLQAQMFPHVLLRKVPVARAARLESYLLVTSLGAGLRLKQIMIPHLALFLFAK